MYKLKRLFKRMQIYHVPLLLTCLALLASSSFINDMVWTKYYVDYSHMLAHLVKCLRFAGKAAGFLWAVYCVKHVLRRFQLHLDDKQPKKQQKIKRESNTKLGKLLHFMRYFQGGKAIDWMIRVLSRFKGRETLFRILYWLLDVAAIGLWCFLAVSFAFEVEKSSSPVYFSRVFTREGTYPYSIFNLLPVLGLGLSGGLILYFLRRFKDTLMCIWQPIVLYAIVDSVCMLSLMILGKDITVYTEWIITGISVFLVANISIGILRQIRRLGKINFAKLHPIFPRPVREEKNDSDADAEQEQSGALQGEMAPAAAQAAYAQAAAPAATQAAAPEPEKPAVIAERAAAPEPEMPAAEPVVSAPVKPAPVIADSAARKPQASRADKPAARDEKDKTPRQEKRVRVKKTFLERTGLSFKSLWTIRFMLDMIPYCVLLVGGVLFLSTVMYTINPHEQALVYRFGVLREESVTDPGLHFKLPYPIDQVEIYDVSRMKSMHVGYEPADTNDYLWTSEHGGEEYTLLLGDGNELVAVNIRLNYWIDDLMDYRTVFENPESMLSARAYAVMMERTMSSDLNTVLSVDRSSLADEVKEELNAFADEMKLGLQVANVIIENIHPPVEVAEVYQNVINASIQKTTLTTQAESYAYQTLSAAEQQHTSAVAAATKAQTDRLAAAKSEAEVFKAACDEYLDSPNSYTLWKVTNAYGKLVAGARLYVFSPGTQDMMDRFLLRNGQSVPVIGQ